MLKGKKKKKKKKKKKRNNNKKKKKNPQQLSLPFWKPMDCPKLRLPFPGLSRSGPRPWAVATERPTWPQAITSGFQNLSGTHTICDMWFIDRNPGKKMIELPAKDRHTSANLAKHGGLGETSAAGKSGAIHAVAWSWPVLKKLSPPKCLELI